MQYNMETLLFTGGTGFLGKNAPPLPKKILDTMYNVSTCGITPDDTIKANLAKEIPSIDQHLMWYYTLAVRRTLYLGQKRRSKHSST